MNESATFTLTLEQLADYEFRIRFDAPAGAALVADEPPPLGRGAGPNPARLLAAAVASCLAASLLFCVRKFRQEPGALRAQVAGRVVRNERGRLRLGGLEVALRLGRPAAELAHFDRCLAQFEDYCVVTQSVRHGVPVTVRVLDAQGTELYAGGASGAPPQ